MDGLMDGWMDGWRLDTGESSVGLPFERFEESNAEERKSDWIDGNPRHSEFSLMSWRHYIV